MSALDFTAKDLIEAAYIRLRGKPVAKAPQPGNPKFVTQLGIANRLLRTWADDPNFQWKSLRIDFSGTTSENQVELPDDFVRLVDAVVLLNGQEVQLIDYAKRRIEHGVFESAGEDIGDSRRLIFTGDVEDGAEVECAIIVYPPKLEKADDIVICDNHDWIITALAAAIAMNDKSNQDAYPDLAGEAAQSYENMAKATRYRAEGQKYTIRRGQSRIRTRIR